VHRAHGSNGRKQFKTLFLSFNRAVFCCCCCFFKRFETNAKFIVIFFRVFQDLKLDENELEDLKGFPAMPSLKFLSLKNNLLSDLDELKRNVSTCKFLETIDATGNPCTSNTDGKITLI